MHAPDWETCDVMPATAHAPPSERRNGPPESPEHTPDAVLLYCASMNAFVTLVTTVVPARSAA